MNLGIPGVEIVTNGYTGALRTCLLSRDFRGFPITIDRASARFSSNVKGPCLYGKQTTGGLYAPLYVTGTVYSTAAASQKTIVLTGTGLHLKVGDTITISDDDHTEDRIIDTGGVVEGASNTTVTVTVNLTNEYTTARSAFVFLKDGTELSADAVIVLEDIDFSVSSSNVVTTGLSYGEFNALNVERYSGFVAGDCARLTFRSL